MKKYLYIFVVLKLLIVSLLAFGINTSNPKFNVINQNKKAIIESLKLKIKVSGEGASALFIPGGLTGWSSWAPFLTLLTEKQRKVIIGQLLNVEHEFENRLLPVDYSLKSKSHALTSTLHSLGYFTPFDVVSWSYGAPVTLDYP